MNETHSDGALPPGAWRTIAVVILAPFMTQTDATIVNVSLAWIAKDLHSPVATAQWVISGYLLALALMLPLNGWLVDRLGARKLYLLCFSAFTAASLLCGAARTMPGLIAGRILQGIAGGLLVPLTQFMLARVAGKQLARVAGYASMPVLLAPLLGPILAGVILKYAGWPWLFYVNLPIGAVAVVLAFLFIPSDDERPEKRPFDLLGFLALSPGLACLLYGVEQLAHRKLSALFVISVILVGIFLWHARRTGKNALIDIELFSIRNFSVATTTQFLGNGIMYAGQFLIPLYLVTGCGLNATQAGWILAAMGIGMMCIYPLIGFLTERFGNRAIASGGVLANLAGTVPFLWMAHGVGLSVAVAVFALFLRGLGQGATGIPSIAVAYGSVPKSELSQAATASNIVQRLGGPILTTALAVVVSVSKKPHGNGMPHEFFFPFLGLLVLQLLVLGSAMRLPERIAELTAA
jgi:EmrB/QacA subfamily drug resistance transporter